MILQNPGHDSGVFRFMCRGDTGTNVPINWHFCICLLDTVVFNTYHILESYQHLSKLTRGRGMGQGVKNFLFNGLTMNHEQVHPEMVRILCVF